jgi:hypothetical protein
LVDRAHELPPARPACWLRHWDFLFINTAKTVAFGTSREQLNCLAITAELSVATPVTLPAGLLGTSQG